MYPEQEDHLDVDLSDVLNIFTKHYELSSDLCH